ncbi:MAG: TIGR03936 family radical SAM-associated protein [Actinomycetota bacterium]
MKGMAGVPVRLRYSKHGKIRWTSHRDVARGLERAFRITQAPLAFTEGFSPRPKVSFGLALPTGSESDGEYLDLELQRVVDLDGLVAALTDALPEGMSVTGAAPLVDRAPALQEAVTAVEWRVDVVDLHGESLEPSDVRARVDAGRGATELPTPRRRKGREEMGDVRPVIRSLTVDADSPSTVVMELLTQPRSAKPAEVLAAIGCASAHALRTHQWIERDGARWEPLDADTRPHAREARAS